MKKIILTLSLVVFLFGFVGCEKEPVVSNGGEPPVEEYPIEVPFEEYLLLHSGTSCQWWNIEMEQNYPADSSNIFIINSDEDLKKYILCNNGSTYPEIDFSKKTLVLVCGTSFTGVRETNSKLRQISANEYQLAVEVELHSSGAVELWTAELIVDKISEESKFKLNVTLKLLEDYSLEETSCSWNLNYDDWNWDDLFADHFDISVINSTEDLEQYIECTGGDSYPEIDFSKQTLILSWGTRRYQDELNYVNLQQLSKQSYVLNVGFRLSAAAALRNWQTAIIVEKLDSESNVVIKELN